MVFSQFLNFKWKKRFAFTLKGRRKGKGYLYLFISFILSVLFEWIIYCSDYIQLGLWIFRLFSRVVSFLLKKKDKKSNAWLFLPSLSFHLFPTSTYPLPRSHTSGFICLSDLFPNESFPLLNSLPFFSFLSHSVPYFNHPSPPTLSLSGRKKQGHHIYWNRWWSQKFPRDKFQHYTPGGGARLGLLRAY